MIGVFGANGFIGKHVTRDLVAGGHEVVAVARQFDPGMEELGARCVRGDLRNAQEMDDALEGVESVVQLMGTSTPAQGNARSTEHIDHDVIPHVDFLNRCVASGVRRFVFASSGGTVYGPSDGHRLTPETAATNPISSHGVTKLMVEHFIKLHGHLDGLEFVILRIANPFGPGQVFRRGQGLIPALMDRYEQGRPITVYGDGSAARDYLYIDDLVRAVRLAVEHDSPEPMVLNVGSGESHSVLEVIRSIEEVAGISFEINFAPARETDVDSVALDIGQIGRKLGWKPEIHLVEGLRRTLV